MDEESAESLWVRISQQVSTGDVGGCLIAFCDEMTSSVNEQRAADTVYLDFCKAFDSVSCNILIKKLMEVQTRQIGQ